MVCVFLSLGNSFVFDYVTRQKASGGNLSYYVIKQLPIPSPASIDLWVQELALSRILELIYTCWDLKAFAEDCGWSSPPFIWNEERRFLIRCELDAAYFHLYLPTDVNAEWLPAEGEKAEDLARLKASFQTPRDAVSYIMDSFLIVKRKDETAYGNYRTKETILEIYDSMAEAIRTGQPYQTRLNPPPADPRCCHPPRDTGRS